jgi:allantoinase
MKIVTQEPVRNWQPEDMVRYSPILERPKILWPENRRVAVWFALNIEHYQYLPKANPFINAWPRVPTPPDTLMYSYYDYANRVGLWRMLEVIDEYQPPITTSLNIAVLDHYPEIREAIGERGWSVMCHGIYNTEYLFGLSEREERDVFEDAVASVKRHLGQELKGILGPAGSLSPNTLNLAASYGLSYCADWGAIDDQPIPIFVKQGRFVGIPYGFEVNDDAMMALGYGAAGSDADEFLQVVADQFEALHEDAEQTGRVMCVALHGHVFGHPHRTAHLRKLFELLLGRSDTWVTTAEAIADYYLEHYYEDQVAALAIDRVAGACS